MSNKATRIIDALGGTCAVARIFAIATPSVSHWKAINEVPKQRLDYLKLHPVYRKKLLKEGLIDKDEVFRDESKLKPKKRKKARKARKVTLPMYA